MNYLSFDVWLTGVKEDAERSGFPGDIKNIPENALRLFWSDGVEASIAGLLEGVQQQERRKCAREPSEKIALQA